MLTCVLLKSSAARALWSLLRTDRARDVPRKLPLQLAQDQSLILYSNPAAKHVQSTCRASSLAEMAPPFANSYTFSGNEWKACRLIAASSESRQKLEPRQRRIFLTNASKLHVATRKFHRSVIVRREAEQIFINRRN